MTGSKHEKIIEGKRKSGGWRDTHKQEVEEMLEMA